MQRDGVDKTTAVAKLVKEPKVVRETAVAAGVSDDVFMQEIEEFRAEMGARFDEIAIRAASTSLVNAPRLGSRSVGSDRSCGLRFCVLLRVRMAVCDVRVSANRLIATAELANVMVGFLLESYRPLAPQICASQTRMLQRRP